KPAVAPSVFVFQKDKGQKRRVSLCWAHHCSEKESQTLPTQEPYAWEGESSTELKDLPESGEEPRGEAEAPRPDAGHPESAGEYALDPPAPASASASSPPPPTPAAQPPCVRELAGRSAGSSSPEAGEGKVLSRALDHPGAKPECSLTPPTLCLDSDREDGNYCPPVKRERTSSLTHS
ncbi:hypothetical protein U0070_025937, partial [Myodes glareolus]